MGGNPDALRRLLDDKRFASKTPGVQVVVVNASGVVLEDARGLADIARQIPMRSSTTMMAYSMSKTITAVAVLQLIEAGTVALDAPVTRYVDDLTYGSAVTVRQLLSHTGGIPNPLPLRWVHPAAAHDTFDDDAALTRVLREHPRLSSGPGRRYRYSNIGYWLLGKVVERASGQSFRDYVETRVIKPLGITPDELGFTIVDPARHATGYLERYSLMNLVKGWLIDHALIGESRGRWVEIRSHYVNGAAFGGLVGTARAFGRFLQDQLSERSVLIGAEARRLLCDPRYAVPSLSVPMTLGWHVRAHAGRQFLFKEGGGGGFHTLMRLDPAEGLGVVVMSNATAFPVYRLMDEVSSCAGHS